MAFAALMLGAALLLMLLYLIYFWIHVCRPKKRSFPALTGSTGHKYVKLRQVVTSQPTPSNPPGSVSCLLWDDQVVGQLAALEARMSFYKTTMHFTIVPGHRYSPLPFALLKSGFYHIGSKYIHTRFDLRLVDFIHQTASTVYRIQRGIRPSLWLKFRQEIDARNFDCELAQAIWFAPRLMQEPQLHRAMFRTIPDNSLAGILGQQTLEQYKKSCNLLGKFNPKYHINMGSQLFNNPDANDSAVEERILLRIATEIRKDFSANLKAIKELLNSDSPWTLTEENLAKPENILFFGKVLIDSFAGNPTKYLKRYKSEMAFELFEEEEH